MKTVSVSIIVVAKNRDVYLKQAIKSILNQTYQNYEIIVVDGQSTDNTAKVAQSFKRVKYILQPDLGLANARNLGVRLSRGKFIAFLDSDDLWHPDKLSIQVSHLIENPQIKLAIAKVMLFHEPNFNPRWGFQTSDFTQAKIGYTPSSLLASKSLFEDIGVFDPQFKIGCDADWFARVKDSQIPMTIMTQVLHYKRIHKINLSANVRENRSELLSVLRQSLERKRNLK